MERERDRESVDFRTSGRTEVDADYIEAVERNTEEQGGRAVAEGQEEASSDGNVPVDADSSADAQRGATPGSRS